MGGIATTMTANAALNYPKTAKEDVKDNYFGTEVVDAYRWLENDTAENTAAWVEAQNKISRGYLEKLPYREQLRKRFTELYNYERKGIPFKKHGKYYSFCNTGLQNQSVLYVQSTLDSEPKVFLDPNALSADGTVALQGISFSNNGKYMAYVISRSGSDWNEIFVIDVATGKLLDDHITWAKFTDAQWRGDGFYYSAYDAPADGNALSAKNEFQKVYYHKIGTPQSSDVLEYQNLKYPQRFYSVSVADDETFMTLYESDGSGNMLYFKDLRTAGNEYVLVADNIKNQYMPIENVGSTIYILTNENAPMCKLSAISLDNLGKGKMIDIVAERDYVLEGAQHAGDKLILSYNKNAASHIYLFDRSGKEIREISLPSIGSASFSSKKDDNEVFYSFTSYTYPGVSYTYDMNSDSSKILYSPKVAFNPDDFTTEQVTYNSKDGTPVTMFLTYKKGLKRDGKNPVFLYGYGGFNISLNPGYNPFRLAFIEAGGIYAVANLRGGGEYGEDWHQAGTKMNKQNVFDDFISAAEYLVSQQYTIPSKIAINGGSNGGLLVGAVVNQRPDLFAVAVPQVGVMDMLRYHKFTIGWNWAGDYGTSEDSEEMFKYLLAYSPLHTIKNDGTKYPAILVTTADHDDRVVPAHSFKYAAQLQASNTGKNPKIIRIDSKAGHGAGKPISKVIDEYVDVYSFIMSFLKMAPKK